MIFVGESECHFLPQMQRASAIALSRNKVLAKLTTEV